MDFFRKFFGQPANSTAQTAKERLLVVVKHQRAGRVGGPDWLPKLREEMLAVVRKYVQVSDDSVQVDVKNEDGEEVLAMSITLPERAG